MSLDQKNHLENILLQCRIDKCKLVYLLIDPGVSNSMLTTPKNQQANKDTIFCYGAIAGLMVYYITMIPLDLGYTLSIVS